MFGDNFIIDIMAAYTNVGIIKSRRGQLVKEGTIGDFPLRMIALLAAKQATTMSKASGTVLISSLKVDLVLAASKMVYGKPADGCNCLAIATGLVLIMNILGIGRPIAARKRRSAGARGSVVVLLDLHPRYVLLFTLMLGSSNPHSCLTERG